MRVAEHGSGPCRWREWWLPVSLWTDGVLSAWAGYRVSSLRMANGKLLNFYQQPQVSPREHGKKKKKKQAEQSSTFEQKAFRSISPSRMKSSITLDSVTQRGSVQAPHQLTSLMTNGGRLIVGWPQGGCLRLGLPRNAGSCTGCAWGHRPPPGLSCLASSRQPCPLMPSPPAVSPGRNDMIFSLL